MKKKMLLAVLALTLTANAFASQWPVKPIGPAPAKGWQWPVKPVGPERHFSWLLLWLGL